MKSWMLVCLVACATRFNTSMCQNVWENCTGVHGEIRVMGMNSDNLTVGRIEMCFHEQWAAVCDRNWGLKDASVVCHQLGFSRLGTTVQACRNSCFGHSPLAIGIRDYNCMGNESRLLDCPSSTDYRACGDFAGIMCSNTTGGRPEEQTTCPTPTQNDCTCPGTEVKSEELRMLGGGLGVLTAILALILVGVVLGWVWYCHSHSGKQINPEGKYKTSSTTFQNPTYIISSTPVQYNSHVPEDTAITQSSPVHTAETSPPGPTYAVVNMKTNSSNKEKGEKSERNHTVGYHVLEGAGGDGDYHVLEGPGGVTYEVPVPTKTAAKSAAKPQDGKYSTLQHNYGDTQT